MTDFDGEERELKSGQVTLRSILIVMSICGFLGLSMNYLVRGAGGDAAAMGNFTIAASTSPLLLLMLASGFYRLVRLFTSK